MRDRYEPDAYEAEWRRRWQEAELFKTSEGSGRPKFYGLDFFPYPSGAGLSVGHARNYVPTDVICRAKRMQGYDVLHPMGFDAFGLPAENEAIKRGTHPAPMIDGYAENYRRQMDLIGIGFDWSRSFKSSDPSYYKWTQWIFRLLHERGLAYRKMATVNWDPIDKTVLAAEEVIGGRAERSGALVEKKEIPQWFFRITDYAQRLLDDLDDIDWPEGIKEQQRNWIGRSEGVEFDMELDLPPETPEDVGDGFEVKKEPKKPTFRVFTTRIDTVFGMTFCVLAPEHPMVARILESADEERRAEVVAYREEASRLSETDRTATTKEKTGVFTGAYAINPANGESIPVYVADYVLMGYGTGAIMAVPGHDERDYEFAQKYGIAIPQVIAPSLDAPEVELPYAAKDGVLVNSGSYVGKTVAEAQEGLAKAFEDRGIGERKVNYKLRDWLISRQRYWGCPIPVKYGPEGDEQLVSEDELPVLLPEVESYEPSDDGTSPLARIEEFVNVTDADGRLGRRETDTMGGFACSSWYFLRFCDPFNEGAAFDKGLVDKWMPVDCYVGGAEHAVMHLLYARFWTKVLYDAGLVSCKEPFARLRNQGMLLAETPYRQPVEGERLAVGEEGIQISFEEAKTMDPDDVFLKWEKMSKSKGNVVTPDEAVEAFGADALRVFLLQMAPFDQTLQWSEDGVQGAVRFLGRVFKLASDLAPNYDPNWRDSIGDAPTECRRVTHQLIQKVHDDIERFAFNTMVSAMMTALNSYTDLQKSKTPPKDAEWSEALETLVLLLAPSAPHAADEIWSGLGREGFTLDATWPVSDPKLAADQSVTVAIQVNGKLRDTIEMPAGIDDATLEKAALESEKVQAHIDGKTIRKVIVVKGKLVNVVAK